MVNPLFILDVNKLLPGVFRSCCRPMHAHTTSLTSLVQSHKTNTHLVSRAGRAIGVGVRRSSGKLGWNVDDLLLPRGCAVCIFLTTTGSICGEQCLLEESGVPAVIVVGSPLCSSIAR